MKRIEIKVIEVMEDGSEREILITIQQLKDLLDGLETK
jgi:hypothetical protein